MSFSIRKVVMPAAALAGLGVDDERVGMSRRW